MTPEHVPEGEAALSHDVRNSMAALRVIVEALRDGVVKATPESGVLDQMMLHVRLLSDLLDEQNHLGEPRRGATITRPVQIGSFLEQWSDAMRPKARQRRIELRLVVAPSLPDIECRTTDGSPRSSEQSLSTCPCARSSGNCRMLMSGSRG